MMAHMKNLLFIVIFLIQSSLFSKEVSILLIRHGETDWNVEQKIQGHTDIPLNLKGVAQAQAVGEKLAREHADIKAIYSSDLSRAYVTAKATAEKLNLPIEVHCSLREINCGVAEGMKIADKIALYGNKFDELNEQYPNKKDRWNYSPVPGEETINALIKRTMEASWIPNEKIMSDIRETSYKKPINALPKNQNTPNQIFKIP